MYLFVREDLPHPVKIVQTSHAAIAATQQFYPQKTPDPLHLVLIGAKNEEQLIRINEYLSCHSIRASMFFEPDLNNQCTSIATEPLFGDQRKPLRKFQLLK